MILCMVMCTKSVRSYVCATYMLNQPRHQMSSEMCSKTSNHVRKNFIALDSIVHIKTLNPKDIWVRKMHAQKSCETHDFGAW